MASSLPIGLSAVQRQVIDDILEEGVPRSQAELARRIGRSRASVHSAVKVLRRRGVLRLDVLISHRTSKSIRSVAPVV